MNHLFRSGNFCHSELVLLSFPFCHPEQFVPLFRHPEQFVPLFYHPEQFVPLFCHPELVSGSQELMSHLYWSGKCT